MDGQKEGHSFLYPPPQINVYRGKWGKFFMYFISNYCLPDFKLVACVVASSSCVFLYSAHRPAYCVLDAKKI